MLYFFIKVVGLEQGFSNFFSEGPDETLVQPERARTVFFFFWGGGGRKCRARSRALEALGLLMLSDAISALFWTIYNLFETFLFITFTAILYALYFIQL